MSNETKWDVFEVALNHATKTGWVDYGQLSDRYAAALPDDLPVIPEVVGEYIRAKKRKNTSQSVYYLLRDTGVLWHRKKGIKDFIVYA